jgi:hypothetical protein
MSLPPSPTPLEHLGNRPFSFYPAILNVEHNEWFFRRTTWSEILVENPRCGIEVWIPRRFLGEMSQIEDPVIIIGLVKELEYKAGAVWPHQRRVIEMPLAVGDSSRNLPLPTESPAPVIGIRTQSITDSRVGKFVGLTMLIGFVASMVAVNVLREGTLLQRVVYTSRDQDYLLLNHDDDYYSVVRKLGPPAESRWQSETGAIQFQSLRYPQRAYAVILMGDTRNNARYIGTMDDQWKAIHFVPLRTGGSTRSTLRGLNRF